MRPHPWLALVLAASACASEDWTPEQLALGRTSPAARKAELGRRLYGQYCIGCHGEAGDGKGPAARFLDPKPRDLRLGALKFAGVASGDPPRDEDYLRVIEQGLRGTAMPSFALLPDHERQAIVAYVRGLVDPKQRRAPGAALAVGRNPWLRDPDGAVAEGRKVYHTIATCQSCHPAYVPASDIAKLASEAGVSAPGLREGAFASVVTESTWGAPIRAPDFLADRVKTGTEVGSLVTVINAGVGGTAMPTWKGALTPAQLWGLAYYVHSLAAKRGGPEAAALRRELAAAPEEAR